MKYIGLFDEKEDIVTKEKLDAVEAAIPTKTSQLDNDSGFITSSQAPVQSVNNKTGAVSLTASDVGALPNTTVIPDKISQLDNDSGYITNSALTGYAKKTEIPTKTSELTNDSGYITNVALEPYAKTVDIPTKTSQLNNDSGYITANDVPVKSVDGATGDVVTNAVKTTTQTLTDAQKQQARDNIGVVDVPIPTADNVGKVPVAAAVDKDTNTYGYEMKDLADPRVTIFHVTGKGTAAEPYAIDITLEELTAAINARNAVFATLDAINQYYGDTSAGENIVYQYQETRTYATATQYMFASLLTPMSDTTTNRIYLLRINTETGAITNGVFTIPKTYIANFYQKADGSWACTKTVHQLGFAINAGCIMLIYAVGADKRYYTCTKNVYNNNANDVVECVCREGNKLYTATITEAGVTMTEMTVLPAPATGTVGQVLTKTVDGQEWKDAAKELPTVTTSDNGKFLRVVSGAWAAVSIANANGGSF